MPTMQELAHNQIAQAGALALAEGLGFVATTAIYNHRQRTHDSLELHPLPEIIARTASWMSAIRPRVWAAVHVIHHSFRDSNLAPMLETADYLDWRDAHPEISEPPIPAEFYGLDPVAVLSPPQVKKIGGETRQLVAGKYEIPQEYSDKDAIRILDPMTPRYFYLPKHGWAARMRGKERPVSQIPEHLQEIAPALRDPHSPALHRNGVRGVIRYNVGLYRDGVKFIEVQEAKGKIDLKKDKADEKLFDNTDLGVGVLVVANMIGQLALHRSLKPSDITKNVLIGGATAPAAIYAVIIGGKLTNGPGHAGERMFRSLLRHRAPVVKKDGTFMTDMSSLNIFSRIASAMSLDEVGGQKPHHFKPGERAYSFYKGFRRKHEAPFGSFIDALARRRIFMNIGKNYNNKDERPDMPCTPVLMLEEARRLTIQKKLPQGV